MTTAVLTPFRALTGVVGSPQIADAFVIAEQMAKINEARDFTRQSAAEVVLKRFEADGMPVKIAHNFLTVWLPLSGPYKAEVTYDRDLENDPTGKKFVRDVFYVYRCWGAHCGPHYDHPIEVAVKNARWEMDGDEHGTFAVVEHDGYFWADDLTPLHDDLQDAYSGALMDALRRDVQGN